jgi:hypothetical protein
MLPASGGLRTAAIQHSLGRVFVLTGVQTGASVLEAHAVSFLVTAHLTTALLLPSVQFAPARPPPQVVAMAPMPPAARQTAQVVPVATGSGGAGNGGQTVIMQEMPQQAGGPYIQYDQQQWGQQVIVQQQQQGGGQQQSPLYATGAGSQQSATIQGERSARRVGSSVLGNIPSAGCFPNCLC